MDADHIPITVDDWKGTYDRGVVVDEIPIGFLEDSFNVKFNESDVYTRDGSTLLLTAPDIVRFFMYKRLGETVRYIYLNTSGQLYDSLFPGTPIWTDALFLDFSMGNFNNRAYITPHNRITGIPGKSLLVYDGSGAARLAAGVAPVGFSLTVANSVASGNIEAGVHIFAIAYESSSGFITAPGPVDFAVLDTTGGFKAVVSGIPAVLPAGMVAVRILSTKAIQDYNGNQQGYEFFLISSGEGGRIVAGPTTATVDFFDSQLTASATYLFDSRGTIPAGVCITNYNGRLCIAGINGDEHSVLLSDPYDPEQISSIGGFVTVDPFESGDGIKNLFPFRGALVICKPNRIYQVMDNQNEPVTWPTPISVDVGTGAECFGVGAILDSKGQNNDRAWIADRSGLVLFEGYTRRPEASWSVQGIWSRINKVKFNLVQVVIDPEFQQIYVSLPLDEETTISHILYGYYGTAYSTFGLDPKLIKWTLWQTFSGIRSILTDTEVSTNCAVLKYSGVNGNIYKIDNDYSVHNDDGNSYVSMVKTAFITSKPKYTQHCNIVNLRAVGLGILNTTLFGLDNVKSLALENKNLSPTPGREYELKANFEHTRVSAEFVTGENINEYFRIARMEMYLKPVWLSLPA